MNIKLFKLIVPLVTFIICIFLIEIGLSFIYPTNNSYYVWKPNLQYTFRLDDQVLRGVSEKPLSIYNSLGARSDEIPENNVYKILAFGGSTTECIVLDQKKTWTSLLENALNRNNDSVTYWIGNFGKSGNNSYHHILQTDHMTDHEELKDAKAILYLMGFNDLNKAIGDKNAYLNPDELRKKLSAFMVVPDKDLPLHRRTAIWKFLKETRRKMSFNRFTTEGLSLAYEELRLRRKSARKVERMPDLNQSLAQYKKNIIELIQLCKSNNQTPIFLTQPVLWRSSISKESDELLYTHFENHYNLETETLYKCMKAFNDALKEVCDQNNVQYIDLFLKSEEEWFYDDCHLNEIGAEKVSELIYSSISL